MKKDNALIWEDDFPPVYAHTSVPFLKRCPGFHDAKRGNMDMALLVTAVCVKSTLIIELKQKYPDAVLIPVISNNKLPEALAITTDMQMHTGVYEAQAYNRKSLSAMERLLHKPRFNGFVMKGKRYIIVDDIITQGGTISALRKHILINGGTVAAVVALAPSAGSRIIAPSREGILQLHDRFGSSAITNILTEYNIAGDLRELTSSQVKYLLSFKELNSLLTKMGNTQASLAKFHRFYNGQTRYLNR